MRKWIIKQFDKIGLDSSTLKTPQELNARLKPGQVEVIKLPSQFDTKDRWVIKKWLFKSCESILYGDVLCVIENNKKESFEFESFVTGKLRQLHCIDTRIEYSTVLVEIVGE